MGDHVAALSALDRSISVMRRLQEPFGLVTGLQNLAGLHISLGRLDEAEEGLTEAISIQRELRNRAGASDLFHALSELALAKGEMKLAARWLGASEEAAARFQTFRSAESRAEEAAGIERARLSLTPAEFDQAWRAGVQLVLEWFGADEFGEEKD
jgi:hypothetical protein